jgi:hypothetical protein
MSRSDQSGARALLKPIQRNGGQRRQRNEDEPREHLRGALLLVAYSAALLASGVGVTLLIYRLWLSGALLLGVGGAVAVLVFAFGHRSLATEVGFLTSPGPSAHAPVQIRVSDPELLSDLCGFLSRSGFICVEHAGGVAEVLVPGATTPVVAELDLMTKIGLWQSMRPGVEVAVKS